MKIVTAALLYNEGKYLLCQRARSDAQALKWEFPGGKLEQDETPEQCIVREINEELSLDIKVKGHFCDVVYRHATGELLLKAYVVQIISGEMTLNVHQAALWVEPEKIIAYDLLPADIEIAERIVGVKGYEKQNIK
ncbi:MAG: ADP-ribose pyrophosphatase [Firmicutes bacterium]|nr:ADP-ribose pyrophosphatase [Bacillota bacterium]